MFHYVTIASYVYRQVYQNILLSCGQQGSNFPFYLFHMVTVTGDQKRKAVDRQRQTFFFSFSYHSYLFLRNVFFNSRTWRFINFYRLNSFIFSPARKEQKWNGLSLRRWCSMLEWFVHAHLCYALITFMIVNNVYNANQGWLVNEWINFFGGKNIECLKYFRMIYIKVLCV